MCKFFSAVITNKNKTCLYDLDNDSHEFILEKFELKDDKESPNFVRVELIPKDIFNHDLKTWDFIIDQDYKPDWFNESLARKTTEKSLKNLIKERFVIGRTEQRITQGRWFVGKDGVVESVYDNGVVKFVSGNGVVQSVHDNGVVQSVHGNGVVESVSGNGVVESVYDNGVVESVHGNGVVESVYDNGVVESVYDNGVVKSVSGNGVVIIPNKNKIIVGNPDFKLEVFKAKP